MLMQNLNSTHLPPSTPSAMLMLGHVKAKWLTYRCVNLHSNKDPDSFNYLIGGIVTLCDGFYVSA